jgi:hypothetical protein
VSTYTVLRDGSPIATTSADTTSYTDSSASFATPHSYQISATNVSGTSNPSAAVDTDSGGGILDFTP